MEHQYKLKLSKLDGTEQIFNHGKFQALELPQEFDLRPNCPPVYNQGQQGSCTAHAGCACRVMLAKDLTLDLSRAYLYYTEREIDGTTDEDAGASMKDIGVSIKKNGICPTTDMPYNDKDFTTVPTAKDIKDAMPYKIKGSKMVTGIDGIKTALFTRAQPVLMGMTVYESMESEAVAQSGILPMPKRGEQVMGGHAVLIVGYKDSPKPSLFGCIKSLFTGKSAGLFIVRNSWGPDWGDHGYFYMPYEYLLKYSDERWIMEV
jgi:C1A family cysteine protease